MIVCKNFALYQNTGGYSRGHRILCAFDWRQGFGFGLEIALSSARPRKRVFRKLQGQYGQLELREASIRARFGRMGRGIAAKKQHRKKI